jgi:cysteinyl-tRNA synthetase
MDFEISASHECEIAQTSLGQTPVNYWLHANMLTLNGRKWQNLLVIIFCQEILTGENTKVKAFFSISSSLFFMLQTHYRSILDFSDDTIVAAEKRI